MSKKVLIADDEELVRNYVRRALTGRGWEVTEAANGAAALSLAVTGAFDALVCDLKMPDLRGEEVIKRARQACPGMKIVAITGSVSDIKAPLAPGVQADGFLIKPFGIDEIRDLLEELTAP
ncbi:MAG: response regulator [Elusimicrobiales bacterium]